MSQTEEVTLRGLPISKGIGIGAPIFFFNGEDEVPEVPILKKDIDLEVQRYRQALFLSRQDVEGLQKMSLNDSPPEIVAILGTHLEMLQDPIITTVVEDKIRELQRNTESVVHRLIEEYKLKFSTIQDRYFQERIRDLIDVSRRILGHLRPLNRIKWADMPHHSIILAHELVPSETIEASGTSVSGFVTSTGGVTSHAAIIARAKGIPYVANVDIKWLKKMELQGMIVDGSQGLVIMNPSRATLKKYQELKKGHLEKYRLISHSSHLRAETIDGYEVRILANLENPKEVDLLLKNGAEGIGLFRSEYLFLSRKMFPTEEEQFQVYRKMAKSLKGRPLVIRVFDIGGDKKIEMLPNSPDSWYFQAIGVENNPALGCRAIRFLLRYPEILHCQLRAILRASVFGEIQVLVPMVSDISELRLVRKKIAQLREDLAREGIETAPVAVGSMIEVPSTAIICDALVQESDFISIGTNDLVQYVLAADRSNPAVSDLYFSTHPSILRLIHMIVNAANRYCKPAIVCGESAADPMMVPVLLGLGIREFSVAARHIPLVKHTIRKWRILEACKLAEEALEFTVAQDLREFLAAATDSGSVG